MAAERLRMVKAALGRHLTGRLLKAVGAFVLAVTATASAGNVYTNSASGNWSAASSWTGSQPAAGGASDAAVVFGGAGTVASTNDLSGTFALNRLSAVSGAVTVWGNALGFTADGATGPQLTQGGSSALTFRNALSLGADTVFSVGGAVTNIGAVSGTGGLIKTGVGELFCATNGNGALSYTGTTLASGGTLAIATSTSRSGMSSTNLTVQSGATLRTLAGVGVSALSLPASASVNVASGGSLLSDVPTISCGTLNAASGATVAGSSGCLSLHAVDSGSSVVSTLGSLSLKRIILEPYTVANPTQTVRFDGTGAGLSIGTDSSTALSLRAGSSSGLQTFVMDVADSPSADVDLTVPFFNFRPSTTGFALVKRGAGVMLVNGLDWALASTPTKPVGCSVEAGTLVWNTSAANAAGVNFATVAIAGGATLQVGTNGTVGALYADVADAGTLAICRAGTYVLTNVVSGTGRLVQRGGGTLSVTATCTHSGGTVVESGTLLVKAPSALSGSGTVEVSGGSLGGDGTVGGPVVLGAGGTLAPGGSNTVGTLTLADTGSAALTLAGGRMLCDLSTVAGACDRIDVAGALVLDGTCRVALEFAAGTPPAGTYTLMTYASKSGSGSLVLDHPYPNAVLTAGPTALTLTVTGAGITYLKWTGALSGTWDSSTENWLLSGVSSVYTEGDAVLFDDTATDNFSVGAAGTVSPSSVTFDNSTSNYVLSASVAGAETALIKKGSKKTTLTGANTYGGGTTLAGGYLSVATAAHLPAGALTFVGGILQITGPSLTSLDAYQVNWDSFSGGFDMASGYTLTVGDAIGGSGSLTKSGAGTVALNGANSYSGGTTVSAGYLRISQSDALGTGPVDMTGSDCELNLMGGLLITNAITVRGDGNVNSAGSLQSYGGTSNTWGGPVTLGDSNARIGAPAGTLVIAGVIDSGVNVYDLIVRNPNSTGGTIVLAAANTWLGKLWIRCGTVRLGVPDAAPVGTTLNLGLEASQTDVSDSVFDLAGFNQTFAGLVDRGTDNRHVVTCSTPAFATLTVNTPTASSYTFAGTLAGNLDLAKTGSGTLTLTGTNTTFGTVTVSTGTLAVSGAGTLGTNCTNVVVSAGALALSTSAGVSDRAMLRIANGGGAKVNLGAGVNESVGYLYFNDKMRVGGTYGATGSGARTIDDEHFQGSGILTVLHGNGGTLISLK